MRSLRQALFVYSTLCIILSQPVGASTTKFVSWFPLLSARTYENTTADCIPTRDAYFESLETDDGWLKSATCSWHQRCLLEKMREDVKSSMASAAVLLGLTPALLAGLGPTVTETGILSTQNPILSVLISLGCPAIYVQRTFDYDDAQDILNKHPLWPAADVQHHKPLRRLTWLAVKYLILCAAIFNVFYTSWELGTKTVVSWACVNYTLPLIWTLLSVVIHIFAAAAFFTSRQHFWPGKSHQQTQSSSRQVGTKYHHQSQHDHIPLTPLSPPKVMHRQQRASSNDDDAGPNNTIALSSSNAIGRDVELAQRLCLTNRGIILQIIATSLAFIHVVFGTLIFSSLLFIETVDVLVVILRYLASVLVSRMVLMYELDMIRRRVQGRRAVTTPTIYPPSVVGSAVDVGNQAGQSQNNLLSQRTTYHRADSSYELPK